MKEIQDIVRAYDAAEKAGKKTALATVVQVQGSSYRRPGARMLITEDGQLTGAISGGCLEGDALRKARLVMVQQKPMLVTYDTTDEDDAKIGVGLGCNGIIQILIEPIYPEKADNPIRLIKAFLHQRQSAVIVTLFSLENRTGQQPGTCLLLTDKGELKGSYLDASLQDTLLNDAREVLQTRTSNTKTYVTAKGSFTGFVELLKPAISLVIIGAGNDIFPLVQIANVMGWPVTVVDGRANYATSERFSAAQRVIVAKPNQVLRQINLDEQTVVLLMTHNYNYDLAMLRQLLPLKTSYVGVLGPKKKLDRMLNELAEDAELVNEDLLTSIFGPVGLDIGAETPEEIALSILSEVKAVLSNRVGTSLRNKPEEIHARPTENIVKEDFV